MGKTALVLSGGGFKGAFQVGALQTLKDNWSKIDTEKPPLHFDIVAGVSVGALNGLLVATRQFDELVDLWHQVALHGVEEIYTSHLIDTRFAENDPDPELKFHFDWDTLKELFPRTTHHLFFKAIFARKSIFRQFKEEFDEFRALAQHEPLREKLEKYARRDAIRDCIYKCGFVSLNDGQYYTVRHNEFNSDRDFAEGILASTTMPIVWPPVEEIMTASGLLQQSVDGGIRNVSPLGDVIREIALDSNPGEFTIVIINCSSGEIAPAQFQDKNIAQIALRALSDIAIAEIFNNDLKEFMDKNFILSQIQAKHPGEEVFDFDFKNQQKGKLLNYFNAIIIQPEGNLLGDPLTASKAQINNRLEHGRMKANLALNQFDNPAGGEEKTVVV